MPHEYSDYLINSYIMNPPAFQPSERMVVSAIGVFGYNTEDDTERVALGPSVIAVTEG